MKKILFCFTALLTALTGCTTENSNSNKERPAIGLPNPASVYCVEQKGGKIEMVKNEKGVTGICVLPNGERIDEWDLYRKDHPQN